jgi:CBS-domain-containing membrane protein
MKLSKATFIKAAIAGICSTGTIGILAVITYQTPLGIFLAASFGSSMVLLFAYPESPFAQPKNVFFGHLITALVGVVFAEYIDLPMYVNISIAVGVGVFFMIFCNVVHPPAGGNPIIVIVAGASYEYLINPIILGSFIMLALAIVINKFLLKKNYPVS